MKLGGCPFQRSRQSDVTGPVCRLGVAQRHWAPGTTPPLCPTSSREAAARELCALYIPRARYDTLQCIYDFLRGDTLPYALWTRHRWRVGILRGTRINCFASELTPVEPFTSPPHGEGRRERCRRNGQDRGFFWTSWAGPRYPRSALFTAAVEHVTPNARPRDDVSSLTHDAS